MPDTSAAAGAAGRRVLYLSYDGLTDPLGGSQILPYVEGLAALGHRIHLISHEKPERSAAERAAMAERLEKAGIAWAPLPYTKNPPILSTLKDLLAMRRLAGRLDGRERFEIVHCRSYPSALVGLAMKRRLGSRFLFDMRGLWVDERIEGGLWKPANPLFAAVIGWFRRQESAMLREADSIVSLTETGRDVLAARPDRAADGPGISVIPCCIDSGAFPPVTPERRAEARALLGIPEGVRVAGVLGALTGWYRVDRMLHFFAEQRRRDPEARLLAITRDDPQTLLGAAAAAGVPPSALLIRQARRDEVPLLVAAADYGLLFGREGASPAARSPVKIGEFLTMEIPVVTDEVLGDTPRIVREAGAGVIVERFDEAGYKDALDRLEGLRPDMEQWRSTVRRWFDLPMGIERYDRLYRSLGSRKPA